MPRPLTVMDYGNKGEARPTTQEDRQMDPVRATGQRLQEALKAKKNAPVNSYQEDGGYDRSVEKAAKENRSAVSKVFPQGTEGSGVKYPPGKGYGR